MIDSQGTTRYYNENNQLHRENGPAVEWYDGAKSWLQNGKYHRLDGPAYEYDDEDKSWYLNGKAIPVNSQEEFERYLKLIIFQ